ncbi:MAG: hypothetical protein WCL14_06365 [Bacteroidota bacterium]
MNYKTAYIKFIFVPILVIVSTYSYSQIHNLNSTEKLLVKKWLEYKTLYEGEMNEIPLADASIFTFSADFKWKKEVFNPTVIFKGSWKVDPAKNIIYIKWEEAIDNNTYQYKIKILNEKELVIEPINANTETVYYKIKD